MHDSPPYVRTCFYPLFKCCFERTQGGSDLASCQYNKGQSKAKLQPANHTATKKYVIKFSVQMHKMHCQGPVMMLGLFAGLLQLVVFISLAVAELSVAAASTKAAEHSCFCVVRLWRAGTTNIVVGLRPWSKARVGLARHSQQQSLLVVLVVTLNCSSNQHGAPWPSSCSHGGKALKDAFGTGLLLPTTAS